MQNFFKGLLIAIILISANFTSFAFDFEVNGFQYTIVSLSDKTAEITGISDGFEVPQNLEIPSYVRYGNQEIKVVSVGENVFSRQNIHSLKLGENVLALKYNCFSNCKSLENVELSQSTESIVSAFYGCSNLTEVTFKSPYCYVEWNTFNDCSSLAVINIPSIGEWCSYKFDNPLFMDCPQAALYIEGERQEDVTFPNSISKISNYCFASLKSLRNITLSDNVTKIGTAALAGTSIKSIVIPNSCDTICREAFQGCNLDELKIPSNIRYIEKMGGGFYALGDLKINNLIFEETTDTLVFENSYQFMDRVSVVNLTINRPIKQITYQNVHYKNGIWITDAPTINSSAFYGMESLESVVIGENVGLINARYFRGCNNLKKLKIADSLLPITFKQDFGFTKEHINYYDYYTPIYYSEFENSPLEDVYIGRNIIYEREYKGESYHELNGNRPSPFNSKHSVTNLTIGNNVNSLPAKGLFENCPLKFISIGCNLLEIPQNTFFHSENSLEKIVLNSENPPTYETGFSNYDYINATLYIPFGSETSYTRAYPWSNFWNITTDDFSSNVNTVLEDSHIRIDIQGQMVSIFNKPKESPVSIYNVNGTLVKNTYQSTFFLQRGIYIVQFLGKSFKIYIP